VEWAGAWEWVGRIGRKLLKREGKKNVGRVVTGGSENLNPSVSASTAEVTITASESLNAPVLASTKRQLSCWNVFRFAERFRHHRD